MNQAEIKQAIPHREPFLWVDEVVEQTETTIHTRKFISPELDVFRGHYPQFPVLPGVLICESAFQAGALLLSRIAPTNENTVPVVTRVNNVKFKQMVRPGDTLDVTCELTERMANAFFLTATVKVGDRTAARLEFACAQAPLE